jgi:hypothetical protein
MTRMIAALCFGVACSATVAAAQSGSAMADDQMAKKSPTVTVTGCVAEGTMADHYMLNSAMVSAGEMMKNDAMSADHPMSFALSGGDLKSHVGHKVEVTGTISKTGHMDKDKMSAMAESAPKAATLKVKTVKMISSTCS